MATLQSVAQDMILSLNYNFGWTSGDLHEFIDDRAYRGGGLNFTSFVEGSDRVGIGLSIDWQGYYQKIERSTFAYYPDNQSQSNTDMNAVQYRYLYTTPIVISLDYYFIKNDDLLTYIGLNAGVQYTEQELNIGLYSNRINTAWDLAFGPEAGIHLPFGNSGLGLSVIGRYNMSLYEYTLTYLRLGTELTEYVSVGVGLSFLMDR